MRRTGWTKLHVCVIAGIPGTEEIVPQLLCSGIDLDATDHTGATTINWAAKLGRLGIAKRLTEAGAQIAILDNDNKTALDCVREFKHAEMVDYLENMTRGSQAPSSLKPTPEIWAWIDQVYINQGDLEERCAQVGVMDQIYSKSTFTLFWLGREDSYTKVAISTIAKLAPTMKRLVNSDIMPYSDGNADTYIRAEIWNGSGRPLSTPILPSTLGCTGKRLLRGNHPLLWQH